MTKRFSLSNLSKGIENTHEQKLAVSWACETIRANGATLHNVGHNAWDIETPWGWEGVNSVSELCSIARKLQGGN
jgi:hypothetical protein